MNVTVATDTAWRAGRLDAWSGSHRLLFGQMHEDANIERSMFKGKRRVFCIASAGDTAFQLAAEHDVVACDINPIQLAYAERRAAGGRWRPAMPTGHAPDARPDAAGGLASATGPRVSRARRRRRAAGVLADGISTRDASVSASIC